MEKHALMQRLGISEVDWVKIDTEGAELDIPRGSERTLKTGKPTILIEIGNKEAIQYVTKPGFLTKHLETARGQATDYFQCFPKSR